MESNEDTLSGAYKKAALIAVSMMGSVLVYVVVAEMLHNLVPPWKWIAFTSDHPYYGYVRYSLLGLGLIGALFASKISAPSIFRPRSSQSRHRH